jgi:hypothetical protein
MTLGPCFTTLRRVFMHRKHPQRIIIFGCPDKALGGRREKGNSNTCHMFWKIARANYLHSLCVYESRRGITARKGLTIQNKFGWDGARDASEERLTRSMLHSHINGARSYTGLRA